MQLFDHRLQSTQSRVLCYIISLAFAASLPAAGAQASVRESNNAPRNTLGLFGAYSPNSSHILLGTARNRRLLNFGISYDRILFSKQTLNLQYSAEFVPVALESDPVQNGNVTITTISPPNVFSYTFTEATIGVCQPFSDSITVPGQGSETMVATCGRRWAMGEGLSPIGLRSSFLPRRKTQPFLDGHGGYMYSNQEIPVGGAASFNFTFDIGAGVEFRRSRNRSMRVEYRFHHISNHGTASLNPGIDNGLIQLTYCFGWGI